MRTFNTIYINFLANPHICSIQIDEISMKEQKMAKKVIIWHCSALVKINFSDFCFTLKSSLKNIFWWSCILAICYFYEFVHDIYIKSPNILYKFIGIQKFESFIK